VDEKTINMDLSVIIVHYKTPALLLICIENFVLAIGQNFDYEVIVVDNYSQDESKQLIKNNFNNVIWIDNITNEGFGRANNRAIKIARGDIILLLNTDVVVNADAINCCLKTIRSDNKIGALGCKLLYPDGTYQKSIYKDSSSLRFLLDKNLIFNKIHPNRDNSIKGLMGSFIFIPRKVLQKTGLFDPDYFMYAEELDLCLRIIDNGYSLRYVSDVSVYHSVGASSKNKDWAEKQKILSHFLLVYKRKGMAGYVLYHLLFFFNTVTNFFAMWLLDATWRKSYWAEQKYYFSNFGYYLTIPFLYSPKPGNGKRLLKRDK